jgi:carboxynorspermidine decarboxylase
MMVAGRTCLAGDVFGEHGFKTRLEIGDEIRIADAAGYTMVKKNWFNGLPMPSIVVRRLDGSVELVRKFSYKDFKHSLS